MSEGVRLFHEFRPFKYNSSPFSGYLRACLVTCYFSDVLSVERNFSAKSPAICCCSEMISAFSPP